MQLTRGILMSTYDLPYAEQNLGDLSEEARSGEDVIIVRSDGQLLPIADVKEAAQAEEWKIANPDLTATAPG
jgi:hypothetical protein